MKTRLILTSNPVENNSWKAMRGLLVFLCLFFLGYSGAQAQTFDTCVKADFKFAVSNNDVKFEAKGSGPILLWVWDFGDNTYGRGQNIKHTYKKAGTYKACLTVFGFDTATNKRCKWEVCKKVTVKAPCNIKADFGFTTSGKDAKFEGKYYKNAVYSWDFGDSSTGKGRLIKHTYSKPGTYVVCMKVVDTTNNCSARICKKVTVKAPCNLKVDFDFKNNGGNYVFEAKSNGTKPAYVWYFSGSSYLKKGKVVRHTFTKTGTYKVCVVAYDSATRCKAEKCTTINYKSPCDSFKVKMTMARSGNVLKFGAKASTNNAVFGWTVNGRRAGTGPRFSDTFNKPGKYIVCVYAKDTVTGCEARACEDFKILDPCDTFKVAIRSKDTNNIYKFGATANSNDAVFVWVVNGKKVARGATYTDTFSRPGKYIVCVYAKDTVNGCEARACHDFVIKNPCDTFRVGMTAAMHADSVALFKAKANSNNAVYYWTLNGKPIARGATYKDTFSTPGIYKVCVLAKDTVTGCKADACRVIVIKDPCDTLKLVFEYKNSGPLYKFGARSNSSNAVFAWSVNGTFKARGATYTDTFPRKGRYKVCVTVKDTVTGCKKEVCKIIEVGDKCDYLEANFTYSNRGFKYGFRSKSTAKAGKYFWSFGDGKYGRGKNIRHTYKKPGRYKVCLTVVDLRTKCKTTVCKIVEVKKTCDLKADFRYRAKGGKVAFAARSNQRNVKYVWTFGDGTFGKGKRTRHKYAKSGTYRVCLVAIQANGCTVTVCKTIKINKPNGKMIAPEFPEFDNTEPNMTVKPEMITWDVTMSPNPVVHSTTITVSKIDASKIEVYDMAGNKVMDVDPQNSVDVNMDELDRGFYFIRAYDEYGNAKTVKFLKH